MTDYERKNVNLAMESYSSLEFLFSFILIKRNFKYLEIYHLGKPPHPLVEHIDM